MPKFKRDDTVSTADLRKARVLEVREDGDLGPRYYVAYAEGGGRGWWPEDRLEAWKEPQPESKTAKAPAPMPSTTFKG